MTRDALERVARVTDERLILSASEDRFAGAVHVRVGDAPILSVAYGMADRAAGIGNTPQTRFRLGSLNKMFTATAVLQSVQRSEIRLQTTVGEVLPRYANREVAETVTVHQLLSHTSGLGDLWGEDFDRHRQSLRTVADYVELFGPKPLMSAPGSAYRYSSYGYVLLGRMLEAVAGETYYDLVQTRIFDPTGMSSTGSLPENVDVPGRAVGYMRTPEGWGPCADTLPYRGTPAGGGYSTVGDLDLFARALSGRRLLDAEHTTLMTTGKVETDGGFRYGYGVMDELDHGLRRIGHVGGAPGMAAVLWIYPEEDWLVVVLTNRDPPAARMVADGIVGRLREAASG